MTQPFPSSSSTKLVEKALSEAGIKTEVRVFPEGTRTAEDAARSIGCRCEQIVKSLIFKTRDAHEPILVLASGPNRVPEERMGEAVGAPIVRADAEFVRQVTGFAIGGVAPVGHKNPILHVYIDATLLDYPILWAAAGTPNTVFSLTGQELCALTGGVVLAF